MSAFLCYCRAIYFATYGIGKKFYGDIFGVNDPRGHFCAAATAGNGSRSYVMLLDLWLRLSSVLSVFASRHLCTTLPSPILLCM